MVEQNRAAHRSQEAESKSSLRAFFFFFSSPTFCQLPSLGDGTTTLIPHLIHPLLKCPQTYPEWYCNNLLQYNLKPIKLTMKINDHNWVCTCKHSCTMHTYTHVVGVLMYKHTWVHTLMYSNSHMHTRVYRLCTSTPPG